MTRLAGSLPILGGLAAAIPSPSGAQAAFPPSVQVRYYDHNYGDFGNEFATDGSRLGCAYNPQFSVPGMVQDTLALDTLLGKKIPRRGSKYLCSANLEKWFDPAEARVEACRELPLRNTGTLERPVWSFDSDQFFPADSLSVEPDRGSAVPFHDFSFCMEINAGFIQRGGEVLRFRGDDDLWVYLDGRLIVDRGGIHYSRGDTVRVDTLLSSSGKLGRYRDLDVYFCSRIPSTSVFGMEVPLDPRPHPLKSLRITDTAGRALAAKDVVVGKTRVCAGPLWDDSPAAACGNNAPAPAGFLKADWDLNGDTLSDPGGSTCVDLDPTGFPHGTKVQLTARSGSKAARISLTLARLAMVSDGLLTGNGRAEGVEVPLVAGTGALPEGVEIEFPFAGKDRYVRAFVNGNEVLSGVLGAGEAGPEGLSGFAPVEAEVSQTHFGKTVTQTVRLLDGVGPVLTGARIRWAADDPKAASPRPAAALGAAAWMELWVSEDLSKGGISTLELRSSRSGVRKPAWAAVGLGRTAKYFEPTGTGWAHFHAPLTEAEALAFEEGDSLSLASSLRDGRGNAAGVSFHAVTPAPRISGGGPTLRFAESPARGSAFSPRAGLPALVPLLPDGSPLRGGEADRAVADAGGPILLLQTRGSLSRLDLNFHDHLGNRVNEAHLELTEAEWEALRRASPGEDTGVRLRWYPVSYAGYRLGTGAYILHGTAWTRPGIMLLDDGRWAWSPGGRTVLLPVRIGFLRE